MAAAKLNPTQRRHLHDSLAHLDRQLSAIAALLPPQQEGSLFPRYCDDLSAAERAAQRAAVDRMRAVLRQVMAAQQLEPAAATPVRQALQSQWNLAEIGLEELAPRSMRGYGTLEAEPAQALEQLVAELQRALQAAMPGRAMAAAGGGTGPDPAEVLGAATARALAAMAAALAAAVAAGRGNDELPLVAGDALEQVARQVCAEQGWQAPAAAPDIDGIPWRLDRPRWAGRGPEFVRGRFARQLAPLEEQVRAALRAYGARTRS